MSTRRILVLCVMLAWCAVASAQERFTGQLTGTNVNVRSWSGDTAYAVTRLSTPARVVVVGKVDDWYKIEPPANTFSVIRKGDVTLATDGKSGVVSADHVWVRAGGEYFERDKYDQYWSLQTQLKSGDKVTVVGQGQDYYKIAPPPGAVFFIAAKYVQPVAGGATVESTTVEPANPTAGGTVTVEVEHLATATLPADPTADVTPPVDSTTQAVVETIPTSMDKLKAAVEQFKAIEALLGQEIAKPLDQRDMGKVMARYEAFDNLDNASLKAAQAARVQWIKGEMARMEELKSIQDEIAKVRQAQREAEIAREKIRVESPTTQPITRYAADGILMPSDIYTGTAASPKRWLVRDRYNNMIVAYVQKGADVKLELYEGKHVGIFGPSRYDRDMGLYVVTAEQVKLLDDKVTVPTPPQPVVRPAAPAAPDASAAPSTVAPLPTESN